MSMVDLPNCPFCDKVLIDNGAAVFGFNCSNCPFDFHSDDLLGSSEFESYLFRFKGYEVSVYGPGAYATPPITLVALSGKQIALIECQTPIEYWLTEEDFLIERIKTVIAFA